MKRNAWTKAGTSAPLALSVALALSLALGLGLSVSACAPAPTTSQSAIEAEQAASDEAVIRQGLEAELTEIARPTQEILAAHIGSSDADVLELFEQNGLNYQELIEHFLGRMSYRVNEITVDKDRATAALTINNVDLDAALGELGASLNSPEGMEEFAAGYEAKDDAGLMQAVMRRAYECVDAYQDQVSTNVDVTLTKTDNCWRVDEASWKAFVDAVYAGFDFGTLGIVPV